jgi:hypothetical protein
MRSLCWRVAGLIAFMSLGCVATPRPPASGGREPAVTKAQPRNERRRKPAPTLVAPPPGYGHRLASSSTSEGESGFARSPELPATEEPRLTCVEYWPEVRYRNYGYDHWVHLWNRCDVPAVCDVASDVNPKPVRVEIAPRDRIEILTTRGSPAREFTPRVSCGVRT